MPLSLKCKPDRHHQWVESKPPRDFVTKDIYVGGGDYDLALHVVTAEFTGNGEPTSAQLKDLHKRRTGNGATTVVVVVEVDPQHCVVFGYNADWAPTRKIEYSTIARILQAALDEPYPIAARERINTLRDALDTTALPGIKNSGLFANHELATGVPTRPDFNNACKRSVPLLSLTGTPLLNGLGFTHSSAGNNAYLLRGTGKDGLAVAVMLQDDEMFDAPSVRLNGLPVAKGLAVAEEHNVSWIILLRRTKIRLYPAQLGLGVGRKGLTETYVEIDLPQLTNANAGYLSLIFSAEALSDGGTAYEIMESSRQYAVGLGERLREKVYEEIIPLLSVAVAKSVKGRKHSFTPEMLTRAYDLTLRIFFRILFQVYAEDRKLLPLGENPSFDKLALKTLARKLAADRDLYKSADSSELWEQLSKVWTAIDEGSTALGIPAYNGGLFSSDEELHPESAAIAELSVSDDIMGPVLRALLLDIGDVGDPVPIDFRSLGVREFGTIYEGLLESSLGVAETDLTLDKDKNWVPAKKKSDEIFAPEGSVYFHNTSGQRKGTGSYFTPSFVVEHLLERSLDPALDAHLAKVAELVAKGDDAAATEKFFDFRVADIAMGSGHFLTAAIDHIEKKMAAFLTSPEHPMPGVLKEILELEAAARAAVGTDGPEIDRSSLLRRQIARRCIYGLDLNPIAVELSRVSIWIHTFVRGLPMSSLDHNLVCGNSLTGIGTIDEALDVLVPTRVGKGKGKKLDKTNITFEEMLIEQVLGEARETLLAASQSLELDKSQSRAAAKAAKKARAQTAKAMRLFDAAVLRRIGREALVAADDLDEVIRLAGSEAAQSALEALSPVHFPAVFPEVFLRDRGGFDVLIGNPPWEELVVDETRFWNGKVPGLLTLDQAKRNAEISRLRKMRHDLVTELAKKVEDFEVLRKVLYSTYDMGVGDADLYRAFAQRNWKLLGIAAKIGIVLPKTALSAAGLESWRRALLLHGGLHEAVTITNTGRWAFDMEARYTIAFAVLGRERKESVGISGPFTNLKDFLHRKDELVFLKNDALLAMTQAASIPIVRDQTTADVLVKMREHPSLKSVAGSRVELVSEFHATNDQEHFSHSKTSSAAVVYSGKSFDVFVPETGEVFAWATKSKAHAELKKRLANQVKLKKSAFYGLDPKKDLDDLLPCELPRIAFRGITNPTNTRTVICALIPPGTILTNISPYILIAPRNPTVESFILGVMNSMIFDWYARKFIETQMNFHLVRSFPIPDFDQTSHANAISKLAGELSAVDSRYADWATAVGVKTGSVTGAAKRAAHLAELDALVAAAYGLSQSDVQHIFDTFHRNADYRDRCAAVLSHLEGMGIS